MCVFLFSLDFLKSRSCIDLVGFGCVFVVILCDLLIGKACVSMMHAYDVRERATERVYHNKVLSYFIASTLSCLRICFVVM